MVNPERLQNILSAVYKCHEGNRLCRKEVESIYNDLSCAVTELHDIEGFLQFEADHNERKYLYLMKRLCTILVSYLMLTMNL